jgi:hypothetical protein
MKKFYYYSIPIIILAILLEAGSYLAIWMMHKKGVFYYQSNVTLKEYEDYLNKRDNVIGWPSPWAAGSRLSGGEYLDKTGSRLIPALPDPDKFPACVSLYGDSFTWGAEVDDAQAWSNVLSKLLNCRVANFGFGGYGTDQAYLRFHNNLQDGAKIVILGYLTENIIRNIGQYRGLASGERFALKPRFILDHDRQLKLIPLPQLSYEQFADLLLYPEKYLKYEYFLPGGDAGIYKIKFPYTITLCKGLINNHHVWAKIKGEPVYADFYRLDHPSQALSLTNAIIKKFYYEAIARQKKPIILLIPMGLDLVYYKKHHKWIYDNIKVLLKQSNIEFIDAGPEIMEYLQDRNPCELFYKCNEHFNVEGYKVLAEIVYNHINREVRAGEAKPGEQFRQH